MFDRLFIEHPRTVNENYGEHMGAAFAVGSRLFVAALKCFVHGVVPGLCKTSGSDTILKLHGEISPRRFDQPTL